MRWNPDSVLLRWPSTWDFISLEPRGKPKKHSQKLTPEGILLYTYISDFSQPSSEKLFPADRITYRDPYPDYYVESKKPGNTQPLKRCLHKIPPLRAQGTLQKQRQEECENQTGWDGVKQGIKSLQTYTLAHIGTHRDGWQHAQSLEGSVPYAFVEQNKVHKHTSLPNCMSCSVHNHMQLRKKISSPRSLKEVSVGKQTTLKSRYHGQ